MDSPDLIATAWGSWHERVKQLEQQLRDVDALHNALFVEPLIAWAKQQPDGDGIEDGGTALDWGPLVRRIIREHGELGEVATNLARELADERAVSMNDPAEQRAERYAEECREMAGKIQYLVNWADNCKLLDEHVFTFPDGDTWEAGKP